MLASLVLQATVSKVATLNLTASTIAMGILKPLVQVLMLDSLHSHAYANLGTTSEEAGEPAEAVGFLKKSVNLMPGNSRYYQAIGETLTWVPFC